METVPVESQEESVAVLDTQIPITQWVVVYVMTP